MIDEVIEKDNDHSDDENDHKLKSEDIIELEKRAIQDLEKKVKELESELLRKHADLENTRRRFEKEKADALQYGAFKFAKDLLKIADGLEMALDTLEKTEDIKGVIDGIKMVHSELNNFFKQNNITKIDALHSEFDPEYHQAVSEVEDTEDKHPENTVLQVMQKGYTMHERLLRPAMVGVKKKK